MKRLILAAMALPAVAACTTSDKPSAGTDTVASAAATIDTAAPTDTAVTPSTENAPPPPTPATTWQVTAAGIGAIRAGMSIDEANKAAGNSFTIPANLADCDYIRSKTAPAGVSFMVEDRKIARVDIKDDTTVRTATGAGIGDTEERIKSLYPSQVTVEPHKYTDGHYLVVTPRTSGNAGMRIVFETDGRKVVRYRSGKIPAVQYVEGCS